MRRNGALQLLIAVLFSYSQQVAIAEDEYTRAVSAYNKSDYVESERLFRLIKSCDPRYAEVLYYLGNCYVHENKTSEAAEAYAACLKLHPPAPLSTYALTALNLMAGRSSAPPGPLLPTFRQPTLGKDATAVSDYRTNREADSRVVLLREELETRIREQSRLRDMEIRKIEAERDKALNAIPRYFNDYRGVPMLDPDYPMKTAPIRDEAAGKINSLNEQFDKERQQLESVYRQRVSALDESASNSMQATRSSHGKLLQTPEGTDLFTKNYVNFGGEIEEPQPVVPMRAKQLKYSGSEKPAQKADQKPK